MAANIHIGTYARSGGRGLVPVTVGEDGSLTAGEPFAEAANASFAVRGNGLVYAVDEAEEGAINVLRDGPRGWDPVARVPTGGSAPCYVSLDRECRRLAAANYESGTVALWALDGAGVPQGEPAIFHARGSGPNGERQKGPHAHCVRFSYGDEALYLVDLGSDAVQCLKLGRAGSFIEAQAAWRSPPGTGPRHLLFHSQRTLALVVSELAATLTLLEAGDCKLRAVGTVSTQPADYRGENLGGHLELSPDGTRAYVSNRGHDSLAVFAVGDNSLDLLVHVPSGGAHPRHFAWIGELMVVAHEKDCRVTTFRLDHNGIPQPTGQGLTVPGACFVLV